MLINKYLLLKIMLGLSYFNEIMWPINGVEEIKDNPSDAYLQQKLKEIKIKLKNSEEIKEKHKEDPQLVLNTENMKEISLPHNYEIFSMFNLLNESFAVVGSRIYCILPSVDKFTLNLCYNLQYLTDSDIYFTKVAEINNTGILLVALKTGFTYIYGYNQKWFFVQSIKNYDKANDALFFKQDGYLCLTILNNNSKFSALTVYRWTNLYFDEDDTIFLDNFHAISSFTDNKSEIIIATKLTSQQKKFSGEILKFQNGQIKKIQTLRVSSPKVINIYNYNSKIYVAIFDSSKTTYIFWWTGSKLIPWFKGSFCAVPEKVMTVYVFEKPIIFALEKEYLVTLQPNSETWKVTSKVKLNEKISHKKTFDILKFGTENFLVISRVVNQNSTKLLILPLHFNTLEEGRKHQQKDILMQCLTSIQNAFSSESITEDENDNLVKTNSIASLDKSNSPPSILSMKRENNIFSELDEEINNIYTRMNKVKDKLDDLFYLNDLVLKGTTIFEKNLVAKQISAPNVNINKLNDMVWTPENWLSYSKPQIFKGKISASKIQVEELYFSNDFLLLSGNQKLKGNFVFNDLTVSKMNSDQINGIFFKEVYLSRNSDLEIKGRKQFFGINCSNLNVKLINENNVETILENLGSSKVENISNLNEIPNLFVNKINGISFDHLYNTTFKKGIDRRIIGNIDIPSFNAKYVTSAKLKGNKVEDLFTTTTEQIITSNFHFNSVNTNQIDLVLINNIDFSWEIVTSENNKIKSLVSIDNLKIDGDLVVHDKDTINLKGADHIIGTKQSDLLQIYEGKIIIKGNLFLKNINFENLTIISIKDRNMSTNFFESYWSKSLNQDVPVHFEATEGVTTSAISVDSINSIKIEDLLLNNLDDQKSSNFIFENLTVLGNINFINPSEQVEHLRDLSSKIVRSFGRFEIKGKKKFLGQLKVANLSANFINDKFLNDTPKSSIAGTKKFKNVKVFGDIESNTTNINKINSYDINEMKNVLYIHQDTAINSLNFSQIKIENLQVSSHNGENFSDYCAYIDKIYGVREVKKINGKNVIVSQITGLEKINNLNENDIRKALSLQFKTNEAPVVEEEIEFLGSVWADNFEGASVNTVDFADLTDKLFYRNWDQNVSAKHSFRKLKTSNIWVEYINKIRVGSIINIKANYPQKIKVEELLLHETKLFKSVYADGLMCNVRKALEATRYPPRNVWKNMKVLGAVVIADENNQLGKLVTNYFAVSNTENIDINEQVYLNGDIRARNVHFKGVINGVNLTHIIEDALYATGNDHQIIWGRNNFLNLFTSGAEVVGTTKIHLVNGLDITETDKKVVRLYDLNNTVISGKKTFFDGLQTELLSTSHLCGLDPKLLVNLDDLKFIPYIHFKSLHIRNNLELSFINKVNFTYFLKELLKKTGDRDQILYGNYIFDDVELLEKSIIEEINGVFLKDVVTDEGYQEINAPTIFEQVEIHRNIVVNKINKYHSKNIFNNNKRQNNGQKYFENVEIFEPSSVLNNINSQYINGYPVEKLKRIFENVSSTLHLENNELKLNQTRQVIQNTLPLINLNEGQYLYVENSVSFQLSLPKTETAYAVDNDGYVMLHIFGKENGKFCGLSFDCHCIIQHNFQISPHLSIHPMNNFGPQRVFSYSDEKITVNVITNTVSVSLKCSRKDIHNELTHLTWSYKNNENEIGSSFIYPEQITGYISAVKFFTHKDNVYVVMSRFTVNEDDNFNCWVYKISKKNNEIRLQQKIESGREALLEVFYSAQGVVLIVCNTISGNTPNNTGIYRFNDNLEKFVILKYIPGGSCTSITAVVEARDSLIILQQTYLPLQVYKYSSLYDNYYFYQTFLLDSQVISVSAFYSGGVGISNPFLCIVTENEHFYIYSFQHIHGWRLESKGELEGIQALIPFEHGNKMYIFASSVTHSSLLTIVNQGIY